MIAPAKPPYGSQCNGCGACCRAQICGIGLIALGIKDAFDDDFVCGPCPFMRHDGEKFRCSLVETESADSAEPLIARTLGIGRGCDAGESWDDTRIGANT